MLCLLGTRDTLGFQHTCPVKAQLMSLLPQASKVSFWFNAKLSKRVRYAEEKRRKEAKDILP